MVDTNVGHETEDRLRNIEAHLGIGHVDDEGNYTVDQAGDKPDDGGEEHPDNGDEEHPDNHEE